MKQRKFIGMLTPSSNTILEPITSRILHQIPHVTAHYSRFTVTEISSNPNALNQFDNTKIVNAAKLLADAKVNAIAWNGTSAGWLGFDADRTLCKEVKEATGVETTTSVLTLAEIFRLKKITKFGLVTPYLDDIQEKIIQNFKKEGFDCIAEKHLRDKGNFSFSDYEPETIKTMVREVAKSKPEAITIFCTNFRGGEVVDELEKELNIPIYDTVNITAWKCLKICKEDTKAITGWGQLFQDL
jgi:maleate isomerase